MSPYVSPQVSAHAGGTTLLIMLISHHVGSAMPAREGFEFIATDPEFALLNGSFRRLEQLEQAGQRMARVVAARHAMQSLSIKPVDNTG